MKYDATHLPEGYDRARSRPPEVLALWMDAVAAHTRAGRGIDTILDLGCGTGRFSGPLQARFQAPVIGVDPSSRMLKQATRKPAARTIRYVVGAGEAVPLRDRSVDLVFLSMVLHHFADPERAVAECFRVVRGRGSVFLRTGTTDRIQSYPISPFFPASVPIMERVLASTASIVETFESVGFRTIRAGLLRQEVAPDHASYADQLAAGGDSVLARLERSDFEAGVAALRRHGAEVDPSPVAEEIDFFVFRRARESPSQV